MMAWRCPISTRQQSYIELFAMIFYSLVLQYSDLHGPGLYFFCAIHVWGIWVTKRTDNIITMLYHIKTTSRHHYIVSLEGAYICENEKHNHLLGYKITSCTVWMCVLWSPCHGRDTSFMIYVWIRITFEIYCCDCSMMSYSLQGSV